MGVDGMPTNVADLSDARGQELDATPPSYRRIQDLIREDIVAGRLSQNAHLKTAALAARFGVSANPIREALQRLEGEGLVVILPNRGARVRVIDESFLRNILDILLLLDPYLVRWFVETARAEDIAELETIQRRLEKAAKSRNFKAFHIHNGLFHGVIYRRHFNTEALRIINLHQDLLRNLSCRYPANYTRMMQSCAEHRALLQAAHAGDVERAANAVRTHIERSNAYILGLLRADRNGAGGSLSSSPHRN
jgi:DNA-binding GntR family transcriptional regulator